MGMTSLRQRRYGGSMSTPPTEKWTVRQCAEYWGIQPGTWRDYVAKGRAPKPTEHLDQRTPLWDAEVVRGWERAGQGKRTDLVEESMPDSHER